MLFGGTTSSRSFFAGGALFAILLLGVAVIPTCRCGWSSPPAAGAVASLEERRREHHHHHHHPHSDSSATTARTTILRSDRGEEIRRHASRVNQKWKNEFEAQQTDDDQALFGDPAASPTIFDSEVTTDDVEASTSDSIIYQLPEEEPQEERAMKDVLQSNDDAFVFRNQKTQHEQRQHDFCQGMYMTMFMDGFHWSLWLKRPSPQCLSYFVQSWRLENASKFKGAVLFTFLLAVLVEGLSSARGVLVRSNGTNLQRQHALLTVIYAVQSLLGFVLMLVTMSFSVELFLSVVTGLMVGNLLFIKYNDRSTDDTQRQRSSSRTSTSSNQREGRHEEGDPETSPLLANMSTESSANLRRRG